MILSNPWALLWGLAIGLIVLLHFRKPKRIHQVSNLQLWQAAGNKTDDRRPILQRIKKNWLLILQILIVTFIVLALARPSIFLWEESRTIALVIDCSASMNAREHGKTRFDLAREKALKLLEDIRRNDRVLIVQGRQQPIMNSYLGSDKGTLRLALKRLSATQSPADMEQALVLCLASVRQSEHEEVFVFSDGTQILPLLEKNRNVHYVQIGQSDNNVAITRLSVRNNPLSPYDRQVYAEVANFSSRLQEFRFNILFEKTILTSEAVKLGPRERKSFAVEAPPAGRGTIKASIDVKDDLDLDNTAQLVWDPPQMAVLLVTEGNEFLEQVLRVNPQISCAIMKPKDCCSQKEWPNGHDVIILDGFKPRSLPPANYFIIEHASSGGSAIGKELVSSLPNHPIMSFVDLGNVAVEEAVPLKPQPSEAVLIEGKGIPLMLASDTGSFRMVRLGFDFHSSNLPLTISFPVLISNIVNWLGSRIDISESRFSEQESNIKPIFGLSKEDARLSTQPTPVRAGREIWQALLLIALILLMLESLLGVRQLAAALKSHYIHAVQGASKLAHSKANRNR